jgi:hypothetical protein
MKRQGRRLGRIAIGYEVDQMGVDCETAPNLKWTASHRGGG